MANEKTHYVYSTLAADVAYTPYTKGGDGQMIPDYDRSVLVKGGAGVADKNFITPLGVSTGVNGDEMAALESNPIFDAHRKAGHIKVVAKQAPMEKVVGDMTTRDKSAPMVPGDFKPGEEPSTGQGNKSVAQLKAEAKAKAKAEANK